MGFTLSFYLIKKEFVFVLFIFSECSLDKEAIDCF